MAVQDHHVVFAAILPSERVNPYDLKALAKEPLPCDGNKRHALALVAFVLVRGTGTGADIGTGIGTNASVLGDNASY